MRILTPGRQYYHVGLWCNKYSSCLADGPIIQYLQSLEYDKTLVIPFSDGLDKRTIEEFNNINQDDILGLLCSRLDDIRVNNRILYLPLDDEMFSIGLKAVLERDVSNLYLPWENRVNQLYFRGTGPSAHRNACVKYLLNNNHANVKFMPTIYNKPEHFELPEMVESQSYPGVYSHYCVHAHTPLTEFVKHKYILIMDGFIIASSLQWVFGSGSVPVLLMHKDNQFWFLEYLRHGQNCVIVYTLEDLTLELDFLVANDDIAKKIAINARELSELIFSPSFQREYLKNKLII